MLLLLRNMVTSVQWLSTGVEVCDIIVDLGPTSHYAETSARHCNIN